MARFDVFKSLDGGLVVDFQADLLNHLQTRVVIPLLPAALEPVVAQRLNPSFMIDGMEYMLYPQFTAALSIREMGSHVASLSDRCIEIADAFNMLTGGY